MKRGYPWSAALIALVSWGIPTFAQQPTPPVGQGICVMNCGGPSGTGLDSTPLEQYRSKRYLAINSLRGRLNRADDNSLFARHLSQILDNVPPEPRGQSLDDAYYAADELANYFDGYAEVYKGKLWSLDVIDQQRQKEEQMLTEIESEMSNLRRENADLKERWDELHKKVERRRQYGNATLDFELRMTEEQREVGLRVLRRTRTSIPKFYTAAPLRGPWEADQDLEFPMQDLNHCCTKSIFARIDYWNPYCPRMSNKECHQALPDEIPGPPSYERPSVSITREKLIERLRDIDPSKPLRFLDQIREDDGRLRKATYVWSKLQSIGPEYSKAKLESDQLDDKITGAKGTLADTWDFISRARHNGVESAKDTAFWWFLDHLTTTLNPQTPSGLQVGAATIKFANGEFEITRQSVTALVNGNPVEIQNFENLLQEKVCDFKKSVDDAAFPQLPDGIRSLIHSTTCP